jgi:hypothetical protein
MRRALLIAWVALLLGAAGSPAAAAGAGAGASCTAQAHGLAVLEWLRDFGGWNPRAAAALQRVVERVALRYADRCVALNQVQVIGSHNSYHVQPIPQLIEIYTFFDPTAIFLEYTHRPLAEQFGELGIRQIELDVFSDPDGGTYAAPIGFQFLYGDARVPELEPPGTKVFHIQEIDWDSTCPLLSDCLQQIEDWSDAHPGHLPIAVLVELKDEGIDLGPFVPVVPLPWDAAALDGLDADIRAVFPPEKLITPDDVRGAAPTLEAAVLGRGWPVLARARGRVMFLMDNGGAKREIYRAGRPSLEGRVLFTNAVPGEPDAAFVKLNDPVGNESLIQDMVAAGYVVRTRADADTIQSRLNDPTQRDAAIASAAQWVSTDYREPDLDFSDYHVELPGGLPGRCNPVNAPPGCRDGALER